VGIIVYLIIVAITGLFIGALARLALPGPDPMSLGQTTLIGIAGSLAAGIIAWVANAPALGGIVISVLCSTVIVYFIRRSRGGSLTHPGRPPGVRR
jgi:uncharacterized membrane protein YeaQ/YmgE (transglycosylase-associated protein family)